MSEIESQSVSEEEGAESGHQNLNNNNFEDEIGTAASSNLCTTRVTESQSGEEEGDHDHLEESQSQEVLEEENLVNITSENIDTRLSEEAVTGIFFLISNFLNEYY